MTIKTVSILLGLSSFFGSCVSKINFAPKSYACVDGACQLNSAGVTGVAQGICLTTCGKGNIWPLPNGENTVSSDFTQINFGNLAFSGVHKDSKLFNRMKENFMSSIKAIKMGSVVSGTPTTAKLAVEILIDDQTILIPSTQNDESYTLSITSNDNKITVSIHGVTIFGVRHGLETLSQLVSFDSFSHSLVIPSTVTITDKPVFPYRGVMIDVARNFISVDILKENIRAMG
jgi:hexosaminidase